VPDPNARRRAATPPRGCLLLVLTLPWSLIAQPVWYHILEFLIDNLATEPRVVNTVRVGWARSSVVRGVQDSHAS
jgi:hypothetical protein